jgi:zinc transporter 9
LLEDGAAVLGLLLAAAGIMLSYVTGEPRWDSIGSILVGLLLGVVAIYLVAENRTLLLGRAVPAGVEDTFVRVLKSRGSVLEVHDVKTRRLTPEAYKLKAEVTFDPAYLAFRIESALPADGRALAAPERRRTALALATVGVTALGEEIDAIEDAVRAAIPEAKHIDIEVHRPGATSPRGPATAGTPDPPDA